MTIKEKLKKAKTVVVTGALAMAAVAAPIKGHANEAQPEKTSAATVEVSDAQKQRQQLFEAAVRANLPQEEIARYVDFPEYFPVDQNGQLDEAKLKALLHDPVTNHLDAVKAFYESIAPTHRYTGGQTLGEHGSRTVDKEGYDRALAQFFDTIAGDSKEASQFLKKISNAMSGDWAEMADRADDKYIVDHFRNGEGPGMVSIMMGLMGAILGGIGVVGLRSKEDSKLRIASGILLAACILAIGNGAKSVNRSHDIIEKRLSDPKTALEFLEEGAQQAYDIYLTETIQTEKDRQETIAREQFNLRVKQSAAQEK